MEPVSLALSACGVLDVAIRLAKYLGDLQDVAANMKIHCQGVGHEVSTMSDIVASIRDTFREQPMLSPALGDHWRNVNRCLGDCKKTLESMEDVIRNMIKHTNTGGFIGALMGPFKLERSENTLTRFRRQLATYRHGLQLSLTAVTLWHGRNSQNDIVVRLDRLDDDIQRMCDIFSKEKTTVEGKISKSNRSAPEHKATLDTLDHVQRCIHSAKSVLTTASTEIGRPLRGSASSVTSPHRSPAVDRWYFEQSYADIDDIDFEDAEFSDEDDLEKNYVDHLLQEGRELFDREEFDEAEVVIRELLEQPEVPAEDKARFKSLLASICQRKSLWEEAETLLLGILQETENIHGGTNPLTIDALFQLATFYHDKNLSGEKQDLKKAEAHCKRAWKARHELSLRLLVQVYEDMGLKLRANACRKLLQDRRSPRKSLAFSGSICSDEVSRLIVNERVQSPTFSEQASVVCDSTPVSPLVTFQPVTWGRESKQSMYSDSAIEIKSNNSETGTIHQEVVEVIDSGASMSLWDLYCKHGTRTYTLERSSAHMVTGGIRHRVWKLSLPLCDSNIKMQGLLMRSTQHPNLSITCVRLDRETKERDGFYTYSNCMDMSAKTGPIGQAKSVSISLTRGVAVVLSVDKAVLDNQRTFSFGGRRFIWTCATKKRRCNSEPGVYTDVIPIDQSIKELDELDQPTGGNLATYTGHSNRTFSAKTHLGKIEVVRDLDEQTEELFVGILAGMRCGCVVPFQLDKAYGITRKTTAACSITG